MCTNSCFIDIVTNKFGFGEEKNIHSFTSRWFSGANDRCGGRKLRDNAETTTNTPENIE